MTTPPPADAPKVQAPSEAVRKAMKNYLDTCTQHRERDPEDPTGLDDQVWFAERDLIEAISAEARAENLDWKAAWYALDQDCKAKTRPAPVADGIEEARDAVMADMGTFENADDRLLWLGRVTHILKVASPLLLASAHQREAELRGHIGRVETDAHNKSDRIADLEAERDLLREVLRDMVEEQCDYMRRNSLGDPEAQHNIKRARALLTREERP